MFLSQRSSPGEEPESFITIPHFHLIEACYRKLFCQTTIIDLSVKPKFDDEVDDDDDASYDVVPELDDASLDV
jgi:hypothetical protein